MKKILFLMAVTLLTLSSCKKEDVKASQIKEDATSSQHNMIAQSQSQTNASSSSGGTVTFSSVEVVHHNGDQFYNPCTNELMTIYGDVQFRTHGVSNDNNSITTLNTSIKGVKAIGESGRVYSFGGAATLQWSNYSNGVFTFKLRFANLFFTKGSSNNFIEKGTFYLKVDADANTSYIIDPVFESYCQ